MSTNCFEPPRGHPNAPPWCSAFETALTPTAAKMIGKWYIGVVFEAANRCMVRWHGDKIDNCSQCPASALGGIHGDGEWDGGGQEDFMGNTG